jgi:hypothetical protein
MLRWLRATHCKLPSSVYSSKAGVKRELEEDAAAAMRAGALLALLLPARYPLQALDGHRRAHCCYCVRWGFRSFLGEPRGHFAKVRSSSNSSEYTRRATRAEPRVKAFRNGVLTEPSKGRGRVC